MTNTVKVKISAKTRPGLKACGVYRPDREYDVAITEAVHLVRNKGFVAVSAAGKKAVQAAIAEAEKADQESAQAAPEMEE